MFRRNNRGHVHRVRILSLAAIVVAAACGGCSSTPPEAGRLAPSRLRIASTLGTNELAACDQTLQPDWPFPGAQRNIRLLRIQSRTVLLYDLIGRGSTQTIWQPLADDYSFLGEGRAVGKTGRAQTLDFELQEAASGHVWTSYRYRFPSRAQFAAQVEWLPPDEPHVTQESSSKTAAGNKNRLTTIAIPVQPNESVQHIWLLPNTSDRPWEADVITKVYRFSKRALASDWQDSDAAKLYYWYRIDGRSKKVTHSGTFDDAKKSIESAQFVSAGQSAGQEVGPVAVTIEHDAGAPDPAQGASTRVKLRSLFDPDAPPIELFAASRSILSNLDAKRTTLKTGTNPEQVKDIITVAWSLSSEDVSGVRIQWIELPLQPPVTKKDGSVQASSVNKQSALGERRQGFAVSSYPPVGLQIRQPESGTEPHDNATFLTWMIATSSETALLALPIRDAATPAGMPQGDQMATEKIPARAHVLHRESLIYAGTAFFPRDAQAMLLFRDPFSGGAAKRGQGKPAPDAARLPVQICAVSLLKKIAAPVPQQTNNGRKDP